MNSDRTPHSRWPIILAILTMALGIGLSIHFRSRIAQIEATTARLTAETLRLNTEQELTLFAEVLESVRALHALSDAVNQAAMNEFIEKGLVHQHAVLGAFGLAQRISPHVRILLEKEAEKQGTGYRVVKQGSDGTWTPTESKSVYYPLTWQSQTEGLSIPIGFDFSSLPNSLCTIKQIERTHRTALVPAAMPQKTEDRRRGTEIREQNIPASTSRNSLTSDLFDTPLHPHSTSPSYWVFSPITPRNSPNAVIGFSVAILHPDALLKHVAAQSSLSPRLRLNLISPLDSNPGETIRIANDAWLYRHPLEALGAQWMFECSLPITGSVHRSTTALIIGLIITVLMTSQLLLLGTRTRKIETEVLARTEDLRIANARLEENLQERAHMEEEMNELATRERRRIGRDLHDSLGQKLTGAVFLSRSLLDYLQGSGVRDQGSGVSPSNQQPSTQHPAPQVPSSGGVPAGRGGFKEQATILNKTLKSAVAQVRNMARGLSPVALNDESLGEALQQLAEEMTALYGVSCEFSDPEAARSACPALPSQPKSKGGATPPAEPTQPNPTMALDQKTKEQLYLIAREAVNNAARHAQAKHITIQVSNLAQNNAANISPEPTHNRRFPNTGLRPLHSDPNQQPEWKLRIEDDGKGLPQGQPPVLREGMGIRIMRHRARLIAAEFTITSAPDQGTCITVKSQRS